MNSTRAAVTFDLWHTLVYLEPPDEENYMRRQVEAAVRVISDSPLLPGSPAATGQTVKVAFEQEYAAAVAASGEGRSVTPAEQLVGAARRVGRVARPDAYVEELRKLVGATPFRVAPDALTVLKDLKGEGYAIGIISNTVGEPGRFLRPILHRMGFDDLVQSYVFSDEHPWTKPSPEIFRFALRSVGSAPTMAVHVGDGWSDIEGARRAAFVASVLFTGLQRYGERYRQLFLLSERYPWGAGYQVRTLPEVVPIVARLLPH